MKTKRYLLKTTIFLMACWGVVLVRPSTGAAHCDTLAGPVVQDARSALEKGDVTPLLKWVKQDQEKEVRKSFRRALAAKTKAPAVKEKAEVKPEGGSFECSTEAMEGCPVSCIHWEE